MRAVDLNSDLGESFGAYTIGMDEQVLRHITSANVACGWHAGDPEVMERTVRAAAAAGTAVGAHPGYPDLLGFGGRNLALSPDEARTAVMYQVGALQAFLKAQGLPLQHVKAHGALYNTAAKDMALAICEGSGLSHPMQSSSGWRAAACSRQHSRPACAGPARCLRIAPISLTAASCRALDPARSSPIATAPSPARCAWSRTAWSLRWTA